MKYTNIIASMFLVTAITGCGSSSTESVSTPANSSTASPVSTLDTTLKSQPVQVQPTTTVVQPTAGIVTPPIINQQNPTAMPVASKAGLNPAHGQPGHRCDISVGAPLDSKPNQTMQPAIQPSINTTPQKIVTPSPTMNPSANPITVAPGMNPQHGQPGHRCDISVGAPLNSKPTQ